MDSQPGSFSWRGRVIRRAAVIGSGQIGPDIALHLVKTLSPHGVETAVLDIAEAALESGREKMFGKIDKGVRSGAFRSAQAERMCGSVEFTTDYGRLAGVDLVVEAASEDLAIKRRIFRSVEELAGPEAVLLSNSSHIEPSRIFSGLAEPRRAAVAHYFFPAERNPRRGDRRRRTRARLRAVAARLLRGDRQGAGGRREPVRPRPEPHLRRALPGGGACGRGGARGPRRRWTTSPAARFASESGRSPP